VASVRASSRTQNNREILQDSDLNFFSLLICGILIFFACKILAYQCFPANWKGISTLALLTPQINIVPNNQFLSVPLMAQTQSKRVIQVTPLLIGLVITAGIGTGIGGIALSVSYYNQLSVYLTNDIE
jgi:hypothetical protein